MNTEKDKTRKPNVIWIMADQLRAQALGCSGDPNARTPNIDNLAAMGVHFTQALSGSPMCCPARGSIMTSEYSHNCVPGHEYQLDPSSKTIASVFNEAGYHTAYFGKWHLDGFYEDEGRAAMHIIPPERRGDFQYWAAYENNNSQYDCWVHGGEGETAFHYQLPGFETDALTDLLIDYCKDTGASDVEQPFFAVLSVQPPHNPYIAPEEFRKNYNSGNIMLRPNVPDIPEVKERAKIDLAGYYAMIENLDWNVGRIISALKEQGIYEDTHIIFFSDHGDMHGSQGHFRKTSPFEESIRVPFIISGEKAFYDRGTGQVSAPLNHVDIAPTTLGLCGIEVPSWMKGTDYSHYRLSGNAREDEPTSAFMEFVIPTGHEDSVDKPWRGIVTTDGWKYACFEGVSWLMFDLNQDPYEQRNLAHDPAYKQKRLELQEELQMWLDRTGDQFKLSSLS